MAYAYVTVLYGNNIYLTGAMVLGHSLMKTKTKFPRVILVTGDVSPTYILHLKKVYTNVIPISYVETSPTIFSETDTRFRDVFTKLRCLELVQYEKIILLDLDMIICRNIDHLFRLEAPAACLKRYNLPYGKKITPNLICDGSKLVGSINAGLMLLKPDLSEWNVIQADIKHNPQLKKYKYPEQDYLSLRYCDKWTSITFNYNFQFGLTHRVKKLNYRLSDIYVIHYSSSYKPWNDLIPNRNQHPAELEFKEQHQKYYTLWMNAYYSLKKKYDLPF